MATRSLIGVQEPNGSIKVIYCHWDGYPDHNGKILLNHYTDPEKIRALIDLGDLCQLGAEVESGLEGSHCEAFARDKGESYNEATTVSSIEDLLENTCNIIGIEYIYIWIDSVWMCWDTHRKRPVNLNQVAD